ncbi:COX aromatic rich motif-containing protein [Methylobacterium dankookense]|uniref:Cytochrome bo(3) ubiquinol oxidase subunit 2 n=1 Tax=Methylobacterium dankookense TaxID=560405 RepID=A0A564FRV5_9HYPH|nr:COX aromatic rich motif-containing protein [Methylobacterium dankookense]GJD57978.1 Cytochrome bo(3) ubiquinol oxidase subunit 2 [Methylobacterium dankookense]VUF10436.1 Cytochrome bo(3) ubiquinol oxidase subunit 2 [Methylobacterium dankookense]
MPETALPYTLSVGRGSWDRSVARLASSSAVFALLPLGGCSVLDHGMLGAAGPIADQTRSLFLLVCAILVFVAAPVLLLTPIFAWHYRLSNTKSAYRPQWGFNWPLEGLIWIPPTIIVVVLAVFLWRDTHALDPYKPLASRHSPIEVQAVALDWKWLFIYPEEGVASVDELAFPAGRPVCLTLTSGTVMQSFFVPRLAGQIYAMAGMTTQLNLAADAPGRFRGENTQFNGTGFQNQKFAVLAQSDDDYASWIARARAGGRTLDPAAYAVLATRSIQAEPILFGSVAPGLFRSILGQNDPGLHAAHGHHAP